MPPKGGGSVFWKKIGRYAGLTLIVAVGFVVLHWILDMVGVSIAPIS